MSITEKEQNEVADLMIRAGYRVEHPERIVRIPNPHIRYLYVAVVGCWLVSCANGCVTANKVI